MKWNDLRYNYTRMLLKTLSPAETYFMRHLQGNIQDLLQSSLDWINNNQEVLSEFRDKDDWRDYYENSNFEMLIVSLFQTLNRDSITGYLYIIILVQDYHINI